MQAESNSALNLNSSQYELHRICEQLASKSYFLDVILRMHNRMVWA